MKSTTRPPFSLRIGRFRPAVTVAGLLILPAIALSRSKVPLPWAAGYAVAINLLTCWAYAIDKRRAVLAEWRIPESSLHIFELLGGWPGAWLAQRRLRHKCSKGSYQVVFWFIVILYQFAAYDSLQDWSLTHAALKSIQHTYGRR